MNTAKKIICFFLIISIIIIPGCSKKKYNDGTYAAQATEFEHSGWKDVVEITIKNGQITKINWDCIYIDDSIPIRKKQYSKSGLYGMLAGGANNEWYDQAIAAEAFVLKNGIDAFNVNDEGYTDTVASCTILVSNFESLLRECIKQAEQ